QLKEYECSGVRLTNKADQNSRKKHQGRLTQARASHDLTSALSYSALHHELNLDLAIAQHGGSNWSGALSSLDRREHGLGIEFSSRHRAGRTGNHGGVDVHVHRVRFLRTSGLGAACQ